MPLTIRYTDTRNQHEATCDEIQEKAIKEMVQNAMHPLMLSMPEYCYFDLLHIDLRDESIEEVHCYNRQNKSCIVINSSIVGPRVCSFGGAIAWNIYRCVASIWPEIDYHISGRPAVIL